MHHKINAPMLPREAVRARAYELMMGGR